MADLRDQLERDLRALSGDALGAPESDRLPDDCAAWVEATIASVSSRVLGSTYLALVRELDRALAGAPPGVVRRLELARARVDVGVSLRRAYDDPSTDDGYRVLVDRVWPRGRSKDQLKLDDWMRDLAPSTELRKWFGHDPSRWEEFRRRYRPELSDPKLAAILDSLADRAGKEHVTLVSGAHDEVHNQAQVIAEALEGRGIRRTVAEG